MVKTKYYRSKVSKTSGWTTQSEYDRFLSETQDISSLKFLKRLYPQKLREYRNSHDLNDITNQQEYKLMQQRYVMINEEIANRMMDINASPTYRREEKFFDRETGLVLNEFHQIEYSIYFNEDEDDELYDHTNNTTSHPTKLDNIDIDDDETDYDLFIRHTLKGVYESDWNTSPSQFDELYSYQDEIDEQKEG